MNSVEYAYDHAAYVIDNLDKNSNSLIEFKTSVDISLFIAAGYETKDTIDEVMKEILCELLKIEINVQEKNGTYTKKNGEITQYYRDRVIKFDKLFLAYHNRHIDGSIPVNPHFHIVFDTKTKTGKNFQYLRQTLEKLALLFDVQFHFMMKSRETGLSKKQTKVIEKMAMTLQRGTQNERYTYLADDKVYASMELMDVHYAHSHNLSYFLKQISIINKCLRDMDINLEYNDINLKNEIYFDLTLSQYNKLMLLKSEEKIQLNLNEILDREILKSAFGFESIVMNILKDKFEIKEISKENLIYSIPSPVAHQKEKAMKSSNFHKYIQQDIRNS